jgi:hypothetical protein
MNDLAKPEEVKPEDKRPCRGPKPGWKSTEFWIILGFMALVAWWVHTSKLEAQQGLTEVAMMVSGYIGLRSGRKLAENNK